jgi:16S rRNA (cytosine967-C5)-methyltransferase
VRVQNSARQTAAKILERVAADGAFAAAALDAELTRNMDLEVRDRALVTELVYGTLRYRAGLVALLRERIPKKFPDGVVLQHLLLASYQLLFLERVPAFAAVNEAVSEVRRLRGAQVAGFANAVLRRLVRDAGTDRHALRTKAADLAAPAWVKRILTVSVGAEEAASLLRPGSPSVTLCVRDADARAALVSSLNAQTGGEDFRASSLSPHCIVSEHGGDLSALPGFATAWIVQEEGSQIVALALSPPPGAKVLDACSGRGNKLHLLRAVMGNRLGGTLHAADLHPNKLSVGRERGADRVFGVDWTKGSGDIDETYDAVLIDAPCSGFGTLNRRPDILLRRKEDDLAELAQIQRAILSEVSRVVAPGGILVYAVCSILREEAEAVLEVLPVGFEPAPFEPEWLKALAIDNERPREGHLLRLLPGKHGTDGYFIARFRKVAASAASSAPNMPV